MFWPLLIIQAKTKRVSWTEGRDETRRERVSMLVKKAL